MRLDAPRLQVRQIDTHSMRASRKRGTPLSRNSLILLISLSLQLIILLNPLKKLITATGFPKMLRSNMKSFLYFSVPDNFVNNDSDGSGIDVEDFDSFAVVVMVGHSLVDCAVDLDIDEFTSFELGEVVGHLDGAVFAERLGEL